VLKKWRETNQLNEKDFKMMLNLLEENFGIGGEEAPVPLTDEEIDEFKKAFHAYDSLESEYSDYSPLTAKSTAILSQRAGTGWTSNTHTAVAVPVYTLGVNGSAFATNLDNTDIPKIIWETIE
jgi:alkaline phosphatase